MELRDYQVRSVKDIFRKWKKVRAVLLVEPTGGGKTVIAARVIQQLVRSGKRVLFIAHRRELVEQAFNKLVADGIDPESIGVIMSQDERVRPEAPIQVASVDTLRLRRKPKADVVVIDEAHRAVSKTYQKLLSWYRDALVLGLTATPERLDGTGLGDSFDEISAGALFSELVEGGWLCRPRVFTKPHSSVPSLKGIRIYRGDYNQRQLSRIMNRKELVGDIVEHWQHHAGGRATVVFAVDIKHSKRITQAFRRAGVRAEHLDGNTSVKKRAQLLRDLEKGIVQVVVNCMVLSEGWDQPSVKCGILARPTKSLTLYLQQVGRFLRPYEWSSGRFKGQAITPIILDHSGSALVHGLPDEDRVYELFSGKRRKGTGVGLVKKCESCGLMVPAGCLICPECGANFPPPVKYKDAPGELKEIPVDPEYLKSEYSKIVQFAKKKAFPEKWVQDVFRMKFGDTPMPHAP